MLSYCITVCDNISTFFCYRNLQYRKFQRHPWRQSYNILFFRYFDFYTLLYNLVFIPKECKNIRFILILSDDFNRDRSYFLL